VILLLPAALLGIDPQVIAIVAPLHLFAQFWYHTQHIGKMGFLEKIIVTPSHHRVHHALNKEYIDKNYGQIFIFWDKLFGTFQEELPQVKPVYGITRPVRTWNPIKINFLHMWLMIKDAWHTKSIKDKFRIWFMPTGWRPADVAEKYPVYKIEDAYDFEKYDPRYSKALLTWSWIQLSALLLLISYLFGNIAFIGKPGIFIYGAFVFLMVYAFSELMDGSKYAFIWSLLESAAGVAIIFYLGDWFGVSQFVPGLKYVMISFFVFSACMSGWISFRSSADPGWQLN
jgi:alkylglycerol monooxygenase